jgi:hypothetical protein
MVECPKCKAKQFPLRVKTARDGKNEIIEYATVCSCGEEFYGYIVNPFSPGVCR